MTILLISIIIFILILEAAMPACTCKGVWRTSTKRGSTRGVVGQVAGLLTLLLALVLGTLIGVSFAYFSTERPNWRAFRPRFCGSIRRSQNMGPRQSQRATSSRPELSRVMRHSGEAETSIPMR